MQHEWEIWLDNQLSSSFAKILQTECEVILRLEERSFRGYRNIPKSKTKRVYYIITKDADFPTLVTQLGAPPKIIKLNTGNLPTKLIWKQYGEKFKTAIKLLQKTKVEIIFIE